MSDNANTLPSPSPPKKHEVKHDLFRGHPNQNLLPQSEMKTIMSGFLQEDSWRSSLNYGANAGDGRFRLALRSFLDRRTIDDEAPKSLSPTAEQEQHGNVHELFITDGVSHGLELLCRTCTEPGDEVWVERPTYFLAPNIFESNGLIVKALPMVSDKEDVQRLDIDQLVHMVEGNGIPAPKMLYIIPSYHNPTGRSMTVQERSKLASFALRNNVMLVADEVYHLLDWELIDFEDNTKLQNKTEHLIRRPAGIVHFNGLNASQNQTEISDRIENGCCISVSSFTKIWGPGVRLGWIDAPKFIVERLKNYGYIDSQGGVAPFMGRIMTHAIESNLLDSYLDKLKVEYAERYRLMCNLLKEEPQIAILSQKSPVKRHGGYFIWIELPEGVDSHDLSTYSLETHGVRFMPGGRSDPFPLTEGDSIGTSIRSCARLCFADLDRDEMVDATKAFLEAFRSFMKSRPA